MTLKQQKISENKQYSIVEFMLPSTVFFVRFFTCLFLYVFMIRPLRDERKDLTIRRLHDGRNDLMIIRLRDGDR